MSPMDTHCLSSGASETTATTVGNPYDQLQNHPRQRLRHHLTPDYDTAQRNAGERGSTDAEVAIRLPSGDLMFREDWGDSVKGWVSPMEVLALMNEVAAYE